MHFIVTFKKLTSKRQHILMSNMKQIKCLEINHEMEKWYLFGGRYLIHIVRLLTYLVHIKEYIIFARRQS